MYPAYASSKLCEFICHCNFGVIVILLPLVFNMEGCNCLNWLLSASPAGIIDVALVFVSVIVFVILLSLSLSLSLSLYLCYLSSIWRAATVWTDCYQFELCPNCLQPSHLNFTKLAIPTSYKYMSEAIWGFGVFFKFKKMTEFCHIPQSPNYLYLILVNLVKMSDSL